MSQQRQGIIGSQQIEGGPDLVVEVLSPAITRSEIQDKLQDYWAIQVQEGWLVSHEARTVEVLRHAAQGFERANYTAWVMCSPRASSLSFGSRLRTTGRRNVEAFRFPVGTSS